MTPAVVRELEQVAASAEQELERLRVLATELARLRDAYVRLLASLVAGRGRPS